MANADDALWSRLRTLWENELELIHNTCYILFFWGFSVLISLQFVNAPYGRYVRSGWGIQIPGRLAWFCQELPSFAVPIYLYFFTDCPKVGQSRNLIALALFLLHYFQRTFIFSYLIRGGKPTPLFPFVLAIKFCFINGYLQGRYLLKYADLSTLSTAQFVLGILIFLLGMSVNVHSDHILRNLRKDGETGYKIPHGGLFEMVSGANFLGEALEWLGFAVLCGTLPSVAFAFFTACNVGPRACQHHRWYQEKFEDYPKNRKAFIPGIV